MNILTLNTGSNSLKFEVVATAATARWGRSLLAGSFDNIGRPGTVLALTRRKHTVHEEPAPAGTHEEAARYLLEWLARGQGHAQGIGSLRDVDQVAHRVVHGAHQFGPAAVISDEVLRQIQALESLAPLHNGPARRVIETTRERLGTTLPMVAIFDTAFHRTIPDAAGLYGLPAALARRHRIRRYGFHGISHQYLAWRIAELLGRRVETLRLITLHLEGGSSIAAISGGQSVDTSMGFTPLEGLMMGTRSGDLDPAIALHLMRAEGWDADETERFLNRECGLKAVSGLSADSRELADHLDNPDVSLALDMFCYRVKKYIGAYLAALGGADAIVFGGGIGENTPLVRSRVLQGLAWAGAVLDEARNAETVDREGEISQAGAALPVWVVPTEEGLMMAHLAAHA